MRSNQLSQRNVKFSWPGNKPSQHSRFRPEADVRRNAVFRSRRKLLRVSLCAQWGLGPAGCAVCLSLSRANQRTSPTSFAAGPILGRRALLAALRIEERCARGNSMARVVARARSLCPPAF